MNRRIGQLHILYCCDTNYAMPMTVSITSVFENNKHNDITVYIFYSSLTQDQKDKLIYLSNTYNQKINLIKIKDYYFENAPTFRWSKETYYRLLMTELLPDYLNRVLYLDCDTIINKSMDDLFTLNLQHDILSMFPYELMQSYRENLNLYNPGNYFQAGVILFNFQEVKKYLSYESSIKIMQDLGNKIQALDQDIINVMFDGKIDSLDKKFNNCEITNFNGNNINRLLNRTKREEIENTVIFHYATGKPWNNLYSGSCEDIWYYYLKLSPYAFLYKQKFNTLKYKFLRLGIIKVLLFEYIHITPVINRIFKKIFPNPLYVKLKNYYRKNIK